MNILLKVLIGFFSLFLAAATVYGWFLVGSFKNIGNTGWIFPILCVIIGAVDYFLIKKVIKK
jgi:hypothetical protein